MTAKLSKLWIAGLTVAGALGVSATAASAQVIYTTEPYIAADPYVAPYSVAVAPPAYVAPAPVAVPRPIVRERTVVVSRPGYVRTAPAFGVPAVPRYDYAAYDYAPDVVVAGW